MAIVYRAPHHALNNVRDARCGAGAHVNTITTHGRHENAGDNMSRGFWNKTSVAGEHALVMWHPLQHASSYACGSNGQHHKPNLRGDVATHIASIESNTVFMVRRTYNMRQDALATYLSIALSSCQDDCRMCTHDRFLPFVADCRAPSPQAIERNHYAKANGAFVLGWLCPLILATMRQGNAEGSSPSPARGGLS